MEKIKLLGKNRLPQRIIILITVRSLLTEANSQPEDVPQSILRERGRIEEEDSFLGEF